MPSVSNVDLANVVPGMFFGALKRRLECHLDILRKSLAGILNHKINRIPPSSAGLEIHDYERLSLLLPQRAGLADLPKADPCRNQSDDSGSDGPRRSPVRGRPLWQVRESFDQIIHVITLPALRWSTRSQKWGIENPSGGRTTFQTSLEPSFDLYVYEHIPRA